MNYVIVEVVCKPLSFRNTKNLIMWVLAPSVGAVNKAIGHLESRVQLVRELPGGMVGAARHEVDFNLPGQAPAFINEVAERTGAVMDSTADEQALFG